MPSSGGCGFRGGLYRPLLAARALVRMWGCRIWGARVGRILSEFELPHVVYFCSALAPHRLGPLPRRRQACPWCIPPRRHHQAVAQRSWPGLLVIPWVRGFNSDRMDALMRDFGSLQFVWRLGGRLLGMCVCVCVHNQSGERPLVLSFCFRPGAARAVLCEVAWVACT